MEQYQQILCPVDFSPNCQAAAQRALELARLYNAGLTLLHVVEYFPEDRSNEWIAPECEDPEAYMEEKARTRLTQFAQALEHPELRQEICISDLSAKQEIARLATAANNDLIVVASHGRHGISALLGSTANGLVQGAPCDVLVVRASV